VAHDGYSEINLHIVWHTRQSLPLLTAPVEALVQHIVTHRLLAEDGVVVHAVGGTENHVHVAISVPPTVLVSELIERIKASCCHEANIQSGITRKMLEWQRGFGVVSFGSRNLSWVKAYIRNQRRHHERGTLQQRLERATAPEHKEPA
jgi:putative transposase